MVKKTVLFYTLQVLRRPPITETTKSHNSTNWVKVLKVKPFFFPLRNFYGKWPCVAMYSENGKTESNVSRNVRRNEFFNLPSITNLISILPISFGIFFHVPLVINNKDIKTGNRYMACSICAEKVKPETNFIRFRFFGYLKLQ